MLIPGSRSYIDPLTKREEIWLEQNLTTEERTWLRCLVKGDAEKREAVNTVPVEVQQCVQKLQTNVFKKLSALLSKREASEGFHIPTPEGTMSANTAQPVGKRKKDMMLAWGDEKVDVPGARIVSKHGAVTLLEKIEVEAELPKAAERIIAETESPKPVEQKTMAMPDIGSLFTEINTTQIDSQYTSPANQYAERLYMKKESEAVSGIDELPPRERIEVIEQGLMKFRDMLFEKKKNLNIDRPHLDLALQNPFTFVEKNKDNPFKHYRDALNAAGGQFENVPLILLKMKEPFYFSYAFKEDLTSDSSVMSYAPLFRTIVMNAYKSPDNSFDNIVFMHEMVHCMHGANQRRRNMKEYVEFYTYRGEGKKVPILEEIEAYAVELEGMNIVLDNAMFTAAQHDRELGIDEIAGKMNARQEQIMPLTMLSKLGKIYFKDSHIGNYAPEYMDFICKMTAFDGYDLYSPEFELIQKRAN
jgi:hypothetical protein